VKWWTRTEGPNSETRNEMPTAHCDFAILRSATVRTLAHCPLPSSPHAARPATPPPADKTDARHLHLKQFNYWPHLYGFTLLSPFSERRVTTPPTAQHGSTTVLYGPNATTHDPPSRGVNFLKGFFLLIFNSDRCYFIELMNLMAFNYYFIYIYIYIYILWCCQSAISAITAILQFLRKSSSSPFYFFSTI
jgi:hypothetical protein